jgi:ATP-dependent helicase/nuclease subunit A
MSQPDPFTEQQRRAIDQRNVSVVLSSGAGCGKTHVLTGRYLSHLQDDGVEVGQVVAITFTDRAAREMRDRIRKAITRAVHPAEDAARWRKHLRDLETAPICTIHSFCGNLLRQHAVLAGLDPRFEIIENVLAANLRTEAMKSALHMLLLDGGEAGEDLRELVILYGWRGVCAAVEELVLPNDVSAWDRWLSRSSDQIAAEWVGPERDALRKEWVDYLVAASPPIAHCLNLLRTVRAPDPEMRPSIALILADTPRLAIAPDPASLVDELHQCARVGKKGAKAWGSEAEYRAVQRALTDYREKLPEKMALFLEQREDLSEAVRVGQRFVRVARDVVRAYQERKRRAAVVDFQDLLVLTRDLLRQHADVREALQERFHFILLDELQDTDPVQMELVELLCGSGMRNGKLFAVGDFKQSIYRFRGADVVLFESLQRSVADEGRLSLSTNFRSQPGVLDFVNALCAARFPNYEPLQPHHPSINQEPCVEFLWSVPGPDDGKLPVSEIRRREADAIAGRIAELLADGRPRIYQPATGDLRAVQPKDIALLFRSMSNVGIYEAALRRQGLDYYLVGGRAFFAQQEIYDLLNLLRCLENPDDSLALAGTLRSPFCCLSDEALFVLGLHRDGLWAGLHDDERFAKVPTDQQPAVLRARKLLGRCRALKDRLPIAQLIGEVLADSGYDAALQFEFLGERKLANLWKLLDMARTFDRSGLFGLADFIRQLGDQVQRQPREEQAATQPENADVIKLMSIHQAKGLEFPVVFVPDMASVARGSQFAAARWHGRYGCLVRPPSEDDPPPFSDFGWRLGAAADTLADWAEDLRILYVACTRARDLLVLSAGFAEPLPADTVTDMPMPLKSPSSWMLTFGERFHLRSGRCLAPDVPEVNRPIVRVHMVEGEKPFEHAVRKRPATASEPELTPNPSVPRQPPLLGRGAVISLPALEWLGRVANERSSTESLFAESGGRIARPDQLSAMLAAENGSAHRRWISPHGPPPCNIDCPAVRRDGILRSVLARWPLSDRDGWQTLLVDAAEEVCGHGDTSPIVEELGRLLRTFADSEIREELVAASVCRRQVEYLVDGAAAMEMLDMPMSPRDIPLPLLRGIIEFLWQDQNGDWHLLAVEPGEDRFRIDPWYGRKPYLTVQAWAVREQLGKAPLSVALCDLNENRIERVDGRRLHYPSAFARVRDVLAALLRQLPQQNRP